MDVPGMGLSGFSTGGERKHAEMFPPIGEYLSHLHSLSLLKGRRYPKVTKAACGWHVVLRRGNGWPEVGMTAVRGPHLP